MTILKHSKLGVSSDEQGMKSLQIILNRYCLSLTKSTWDAEDLAQETWLKALGYLNAPTESMNPEALLLRIARNTWIDAGRRKSVHSRVMERGQFQTVTLPETGAFEIELAFQALLNHLSPLQRSVFLMRDVFGYSAMETAEKLGTTEGAVKAALHRARQAMFAVRQELEAEGAAISQKTELKNFLNKLAVSYEQGHIETLIDLVGEHEAHDIASMELVHNLQPEMRMAA